jgi:hypothetical protein
MWSPEEMGEYDAMYNTEYHGGVYEEEPSQPMNSTQGYEIMGRVANALKSATYDDYDAHSNDNEPEVTHRYMIVLVGMTGFLDKADIVIRARSEEHAESLAAGIASACGGATIDSVYELD